MCACESIYLVDKKSRRHWFSKKKVRNEKKLIPTLHGEMTKFQKYMRAIVFVLSSACCDIRSLDQVT